jgi:dipeptidyl aminopeptidase/acylaminoacyl peptidase
MRFRIVTLLTAILLVGAGCSNDDAPIESGSDAAAAAGAAPDAGRPRQVPTYAAETFFMTTSYSAVSSGGYAFTASGDRVLVSSDESGVFNVRAFDVSTGKSKALTDSDSNAIFAVSYFPRDDRLLYTFDQGGNELNHIFVREANGEHRDLTPGEKVKATFWGWSGDGRHFWIGTTERDGRHFDVYRYDTSDYARELVFQNDAGFEPAALSPDGRWLALAKPRTSADADIYLKALDDEEPPRLVTAHTGNVSHSVLTFTPDSKQLYYLTDEFGEFAQAWAHDLASGEKSPVIQADWDVQYVAFSNTGRYRVSGVNADAVTEVTLIDTRTGDEVSLPELPPGDIRNVRFSADDSRMAFLLNGDTQPSDLFVVGPADGFVRQYTHALNPAIDQNVLVESTIVRYPSFDGLEIPAVLYRPHQASADDPVPALVFVHGGPGGQTRKGYRAFVQHLVNHGYAVLGANNRGSGGYGKTFFHLDDRRHGEEDLKDIVWGRKYLETLDWVDGERIGVIGGSYGGYMTAAALAFHPEAFDVGINIFGVTNWERTLQSIPPWWESFKEALYDEMGDPATDAERHHRISPLFHADNIVRPLLVVQGANDPRVLQVESDELVAAVKDNDVPVEYVVFEDEGHGFVKRENRITASEAYVAFLQRYLARGND